MAYQGVPKVQKVMVQPINLIFRYTTETFSISRHAFFDCEIPITNRVPKLYHNATVLPHHIWFALNLIFRYLQSRTLVSIWLYETVNTRMEGVIIGFDEYMNLVLDEACEVHVKNGTKKSVSIQLESDSFVCSTCNKDFITGQA